jgi:hypothetical protein
MSAGSASPLYVNPVFLSALFSWILAQLMKAVVELFKNRTHSAREILITFLWATGGMPSSHSALVSGLATAIGFTQGLGSPLFAAMLFYGGLTVRDALGVRRAAGLQARALNRMGRELSKRYGISYEPVKEIHGHTMPEVSVGILLGFFIATAFCRL